MTPAAITARLLVLETFAVTALAMALDRPDDADHIHARSLLDHLHAAAVGLGEEAGPAVEVEARRYSAEMTELVLENLRNAGGELA